MEKLHDKHRFRLKERFIENGLESFSDHEVIELLLFFSIPRVNTNLIAHRLMKRFGTLSEVFEAEYSDLCKVEGVGPSSAMLIKLMTPLFKRYTEDKKSSRKKFESREEIGKFLVNHYLGESREKVVLLLFDASLRMTGVITVHEGSVNSSDINPSRIAELVFTRRASSFAIAHNHPGGTTDSSESDKYITFQIYQAFSGFDVKFRDHFIIAGGEYSTILSESLAYFAPAK